MVERFEGGGVAREEEEEETVTESREQSHGRGASPLRRVERETFLSFWKSATRHYSPLPHGAVYQTGIGTDGGDSQLGGWGERREREREQRQNLKTALLILVSAWGSEF